MWASPTGGVWCAGVGALSVVATRRGALIGTARIRVRPSEALGQGNLVGHLLLGPTCPVERVDDPCDPVARPDPVTLVVLDGNGVESRRDNLRNDCALWQNHREWSGPKSFGEIQDQLSILRGKIDNLFEPVAI